MLTNLVAESPGFNYDYFEICGQRHCSIIIDYIQMPFYIRSRAGNYCLLLEHLQSIGPIEKDIAGLK